MPTSYRQIFYHIVFRTENSERTLPLEHCEELYRYMWGIVKNLDTHLYRINGMEEHIHLFTDLHPSVALASFVQKVKTASSLWLKRNPRFPHFRGWAEGYAALTYAFKDKDTVINYIINQRKHHSKTPFSEEYRTLLLEAGVKIDERYFP
ncbi:MAG: IS200/IS605 family transposase [Kiritimatiellaeota bacterium]|nr:IS200/IS605 family transposase [Kiritimatiellota bacterium]